MTRDLVIISGMFRRAIRSSSYTFDNKKYYHDATLGLKRINIYSKYKAPLCRPHACSAPTTPNNCRNNALGNRTSGKVINKKSKLAPADWTGEAVWDKFSKEK